MGVAQSDLRIHMSWAMAPIIWWPYGLTYGITTRNLLPTKTNPGHVFPFELAHQQAPKRDVLEPFGYLLVAHIDPIDRRGKNNHNNTTRKCDMLGYDLNPNGHPNGYIIYHLDLGTTIVRPRELLTFNADTPAMQYVAKLYKHKYSITLIGSAVTMSDKSPRIYGKITACRQNNKGIYSYTIMLEDGTTTKYPIQEIMLYMRLASAYPPNANINIPVRPKFRTTR